MVKRNAAVRQYLREMRKGIPCSGKQKRLVLRQIKESIHAFLAEKPNANYEDISSRFGTSQQITASYLEGMDLQDLTRQLRIRKRIVGITCAAAAIILAIWIGVVTTATLSHYNSMDGHFAEYVTVDDGLQNDEGGN